MNSQLNKLRSHLFEKAALGNMKAEIMELLNQAILSYEQEKKILFDNDQRVKAKLILLEKAILPMVTDPFQKGIIFGLSAEIKNAKN